MKFLIGALIAISLLLLAGKIVSSTETVVIKVNIPPAITLHSPSNGSYASKNLTIDVETNELVMYIKRSLDHGENVTLCESCNRYNSTNLTNLSEGTHSLGIYATNYINSDSLEVFFAVDTTVPVIEFTNATGYAKGKNGNNWSNTNNITFYVSVSESNPSHCMVYSNYSVDGSYMLNDTFSYSSNAMSNSAALFMNDGSYSWNISCNDSVGQASHHDGNVVLNIDSANPIIILTNDDELSAFRTVNFTFAVLENSLDACTLWINETVWGPRNNATISELNGSYNFTFTFSDDATYLWNVECNDSAGNVAFGSTNYTINVDTIPLSAVIIAPANESNLTTSSVWLNLTTNENAICSYYLENCSRYKTSNATDVLEELELGVYNLGGRNYNATPVFVDLNIARFRVNGELTDTLSEGSTDYLSDGSSITLVNAVVQEFGGGRRLAEFTLTTPTSGCSRYGNMQKAIMDTTNSTAHSELITGVNDTFSNTYYFLTANCTNSLLSSNTSHVTFHVDTIKPAPSNIRSLSVTNNSASIAWGTSENSSSTVEYGLNSSYGSSVKSTYYKTEHLITLTELQPGTVYHYRVKSSDSFGNGNISQDHSFTTSVIELITLTMNADITNTVNSSITNTTLDIATNGTAAEVSINITFSKESLTNNGLSVNKLKYIDINADEILSQILSFVMIKVYYTDKEIPEQNISESSLGIYWYNSTSGEWVKLTSSLNWVFGTGVDEIKNYVWVNVSHFSSYGVGGLVQDGYACSSNGQCTSNYCDAGICATPSSGNNNAGSGGGGGGGGGGGKGNGYTNVTNATEKNVEKERKINESVEVREETPKGESPKVTQEIRKYDVTQERETVKNESEQQQGLFGKLFNQIKRGSNLITGGVIGTSGEGKIQLWPVIALAGLIMVLMILKLRKVKPRPDTY